MLHEAMEEKEPVGYKETVRAIGKIVDYCNNRRYYGALEFLPPVECYRGRLEEWVLSDSDAKAGERRI